MAYVDVVLADSPVAYYRMGEASGLIQDSSGNGNHATSVVGTPIYSVAGALFGDANTTIETDAANENFVVPHHASLNTGDVFTLEVWFRHTISPLQLGRVCQKGTSESWRFSYAVSSAGLVNLQKIETDLTTTKVLISTIPLEDEIWHHVLISKDGDSADLYIDGCNATIIADPNETGVIPTFLDNAGDLVIGPVGAQGGRVCLDELAIYNTKLSSARVVAHWEAGIDPARLSIAGVGASAIGPGI